MKAVDETPTLRLYCKQTTLGGAHDGPAGYHMTARQVIKRLEEDGWYEVRQSGSHKQFQHDTKLGTVTVPMHRGDIPRGTLRNIFRQAGLENTP